MAETPPSDRDSERRNATVVFADISGFTAMSEKLDPEEVTSLINRCFHMLEEVVTAHGGHVDKYMGDCIMALFGVPTALEDAPKQAVNAAIEMRNRLHRWREERHLPVPIDVHIGINTGLVLAGHVGGATKRDFTVVGDTVNLASRFKDAAPIGSIWVGTQTWRSTREEFEYRELKPLTLKGKEKPVQAWDLLSKKERLHRPKAVRGERMIFSEMIGREAEHAALEAAVTDVLQGHGAIVTLLGEAGLGKSRLMAEVFTAERLAGATLLEGRSLSVGQSLSFHPFVDLLRGWAGIADDDAEQAAFAKLEVAVGALFADGAGEILPFIATLMGMRLGGAHAERIQGIDGEALEKIITKSVRELFQRVAAVRPLVLAFEDVHWADLSSIKLLESLLRLAVESPVLFVLVLRPDYPQTSQRLRRLVHESFPQQHRDVALEPLDAAQCDDLIRSLLKVDDLPYGIRAMISRKTEGNPFFIEEVLRSLIDEGVLEQHDDIFRVTGNIEAVVIPGTIQEVIMARIDRLPDASRHLLQVASVIGRNSPHRILADITRGELELEWELAYLKKRQLLFERRAGDEVEYCFKHALAQDAIYESILQKTRKDLHLRVARAIESLFADRLPDFFGMLAYHYSRAESVEKAEEYLFKAGDAAAGSAASSEALSYFREASRLYMVIHGEGGDTRKKALLEKNIGLALLNTGNLTECIEHFDRALAHHGDPVPRTPRELGVRFAADLTAVLFNLYVVGARRRGKAGDRHRDVLQIRYPRTKAQSTSDPKRLFLDYFGTIRRVNATEPAAIPEEACGFYVGFAAILAYSGLPFALGRRFLGVAKGLIREGSAKDLFVYRSVQFVHDYLEGNWSEEQVLDPQLVEQGLRYGIFWELNTYLGMSCERKIRRGEWAAAEADIAKLRDVREGYGFEFARSNEYFMPAFLALERRELDAALAGIERYYRDRHEGILHVLALGMRAKIQTLAGDRDAAEATLAEAERLVGRLGRMPPYHLSAYRMSRFLFDVTELEAALADGAPGTRALARRARKSARAALRLVPRIARDRPEAYRLAGRLAWLTGRKDRALRSWATALAECERLGARPELARTHAELAERLAVTGGKLAGLDADGHRAAAERLRTELGLDATAPAAAPLAGASVANGG